MNKHHFTVTIETRTAEEAESKIKALITLATRLTSGELTKLAMIVQNDPVKTALAKKYIGA